MKNMPLPFLILEGMVLDFVFGFVMFHICVTSIGPIFAKGESQRENYCYVGIEPTSGLDLMC